MFPTIFDQSTVPVLEQVIGFAQARHEVLAGNIANFDTPGYEVRDLSVDAFQTRLQEAIDARDEQYTEVSPGLFQNEPAQEMREVRETFKNVMFHDGSDISIEHQVTELSKNQFMHNLAISIMNSQFQLIQTAISERV
ncbi:MAG: flagellar basal-body rod protein FlgB [Pirellulaceae bacterium]|jgi:flagellar basal-body rod protein FlgB